MHQSTVSVLCGPVQRPVIIMTILTVAFIFMAVFKGRLLN